MPRACRACHRGYPWEKQGDEIAQLTEDSLLNRHFHHFGEDCLNPVMDALGCALLVPIIGNHFLCDL